MEEPDVVSADLTRVIERLFERQTERARAFALQHKALEKSQIVVSDHQRNWEHLTAPPAEPAKSPVN